MLVHTAISVFFILLIRTGVNLITDNCMKVSAISKIVLASKEKFFDPHLGCTPKKSHDCFKHVD